MHAVLRVWCSLMFCVCMCQPACVKFSKHLLIDGTDGQKSLTCLWTGSKTHEEIIHWLTFAPIYQLKYNSFKTQTLDKKNITHLTVSHTHIHTSPSRSAEILKNTSMRQWGWESSHRLCDVLKSPLNLSVLEVGIDSVFVLSHGNFRIIVCFCVVGQFI